MAASSSPHDSPHPTAATTFRPRIHPRPVCREAPTGGLADLVPPPRKHRHRYHGVFAPNHKLRRAVTALAIGNIGKRCEAATDGHAVGGPAPALTPGKMKG